MLRHQGARVIESTAPATARSLSSLASGASAVATEATVFYALVRHLVSRRGAGVEGHTRCRAIRLTWRGGVLSV